jgi:hypothetical protein
MIRNVSLVNGETDRLALPYDSSDYLDSPMTLANILCLSYALKYQ